jgi:hypothetical protein
MSVCRDYNTAVQNTEQNYTHYCRGTEGQRARGGPELPESQNKCVFSPTIPENERHSHNVLDIQNRVRRLDIQRDDLAHVRCLDENLELRLFVGTRNRAGGGRVVHGNCGTGHQKSGSRTDSIGVAVVEQQRRSK